MPTDLAEAVFSHPFVLAAAAAPKSDVPAQAGPAPTTTGAAGPLIVRYMTDKALQQVVPLDFPLEIAGKPYVSVTIKRLTTGEVEDFMELLRAAPDGKAGRFPMFLDERGDLLTDDVWRVLMDDDTAKLNEAAAGFLPVRFRAVPTTSPSDPAISDTGGSSSVG